MKFWLRLIAPANIHGSDKPAHPERSILVYTQNVRSGQNQRISAHASLKRDFIQSLLGPKSHAPVHSLKGNANQNE